MRESFTTRVMAAFCRHLLSQTSFHDITMQRSEQTYPSNEDHADRKWIKSTIHLSSDKRYASIDVILAACECAISILQSAKLYVNTVQCMNAYHLSVLVQGHCYGRHSLQVHPEDGRPLYWGIHSIRSAVTCADLLHSFFQGCNAYLSLSDTDASSTLRWRRQAHW